MKIVDRRAYLDREAPETAPPVPAVQAIVEDDAPQWSGLYDAAGDKLYHPSPRIRPGFIA